jgi:DnaJ family protein C protein 3
MEPKNENNFYKRYRVFMRQQKYKEALADLNSALNINPENIQVLTQRGKLQVRLGRCKEAEQDYDQLQKYDSLVYYIGVIIIVYKCSID